MADINRLLVLLGLIPLGKIPAQDVSDVTRPVTSAEYAGAHGLFVGGTFSIADGDNPLSADSAYKIIVDRTKLWVRDLESRPIKGLQLDPMGQLYAAIDRDSVAVKQFNERLADKSLSLQDKAYTLSLAISIFSDPRKGNRMRIAFDYLRKLDTLSNDVALWKYQAHTSIANTYYRSAISPHDVISHILQAYAQVSIIPFEKRGIVYRDKMFLVLCDVVASTPANYVKIDSIQSLLQSMSRYTSNDTTRYRMGLEYERDFNKILSLSKHIGKVAPPIVATHWYNTKTPYAPSVSIQNGSIQVLLFGTFSCAGCHQEAQELRNKLAKTVEVWWVTTTEGAWGATFREPNEEAKHLENYYLKRKKYTYSIALYAPPKVKTIDGGLLPSRNPSFTAYPIQDFTIVLIDGDGIVRSIVVAGNYSRDLVLAKVAELATQKRTTL